MTNTLTHMTEPFNAWEPGRNTAKEQCCIHSAKHTEIDDKNSIDIIAIENVHACNAEMLLLKDCSFIAPENPFIK